MYLANKETVMGGALGIGLGLADAVLGGNHLRHAHGAADWMQGVGGVVGGLGEVGATLLHAAPGVGGAFAGVGAGAGLGAGISDWYGSMAGEPMNGTADGIVTGGLMAAGGVAGAMCPALAPFMAGAGIIGHLSGMAAHSREEGGHTTLAEGTSTLGMMGSGAMLGAGIGSIVPAVTANAPPSMRLRKLVPLKVATEICARSMLRPLE